MDLSELLAFAILITYFILIFLSFGLVFRSILAGTNVSKLLEGRAFFFLRTALGALLCTWYFMIQFMIWSYNDYSFLHKSSSVGQWLVNTKLFEQAWTIVCQGPANWWWSSWICTWTIVFTAVIRSESGRRDIKYPYAYMLLGQLVAMSVATGLFLVAISLHPLMRTRTSPTRAPLMIALPLAMAFLPTHLLPQQVGTEKFMQSLLWLHGALLLPLMAPASDDNAGWKSSVPWGYLYALLVGLMAFIHIPASRALLAALPRTQSLGPRLIHTIFSHPAQGSISLDVVWVGLIVISWAVLSGPIYLQITKGLVVGAVSAVIAARYTGVNWALIASVIPMGCLLGFGGLVIHVQSLRSRNATKRAELLDMMGMAENTVVQGTASTPPSKTGKKTVVGFWHPYCNAGGGGERVLWVAVRHIQQTEKDTLVLVYSGDYPAASKESIISKVEERFSIILDPGRLHFIPLPSRHLVSDGYWKKFTLLGQSLGSVVLAWEGICGKDGLWGDVFIDSMGYGFTFPTVRLIAGSDIAIGSYTHYPTVSTDMVRRVRERSFGVENAGASTSWLRTQVKLVYYKIFTALYSVSLLYSQYIMTNSSWTQAHIQSLLASARQSFLASLVLKDEVSLLKKEERGEARKEERAQCEVVYPPCDTKGLVGLGKLESRRREVVSLAQFRPEKEHAKQLYAIEVLFKDHPEYREGPQRIKLVMMGGVRDEADQARLDGLRELAIQLGVDANVEFVANAPYPEIVRRLGEASVGLNTMMDEHFGINIVEFMAAGLIPVVHASAGPLLDIVVPYKGQRTGYHATDAPSFATALHEAFSLSPSQSLKMRKAARALAVEKFSEQMFEKSWDKGWKMLKSIAARG